MKKGENQVTELLNIVGDVWNAITGTNGLVSVMIATPILLFPLAFVFAGKVVGLTKSLLGTRGRRGR